MLLQKGYIREPVELWQRLEPFFIEGLYGDAVPTSSFSKALASIKTRGANEAFSKRVAAKRQEIKEAAHTDRSGVHKNTNPDMNAVFRTKTRLVMFEQAGWNPDRISELNIFPHQTMRHQESR